MADPPFSDEIKKAIAEVREALVEGGLVDGNSMTNVPTTEPVTPLATPSHMPEVAAEPLNAWDAQLQQLPEPSPPAAQEIAATADIAPPVAAPQEAAVALDPWEEKLQQIPEPQTDKGKDIAPPALDLGKDI